MPTVDLTGVDANAFDALPKGSYRVIVDRPPEIRVSGNSGNETGFWLFRVVQCLRTSPPSDAEAMAALENRTVAHNTSFSPQALWNLKATLIALGEDPEALEGSIDIDEEYLAQFEGREAVVSLNQREYQGQMTNNVSNIRALREEEAGALA